jgi:hypothetical protein
MMTLYEKICAIYPSLQASDFHPIHGIILLQNDGAEDYIQKWEHPTLIQPNQEQLDKGQL